MTTLASAVAYVELLQQGKLIASLNFNPIETYTADRRDLLRLSCGRWCRRPTRWSGGWPSGRMMTHSRCRRHAASRKRFGEPRRRRAARHRPRRDAGRAHRHPRRLGLGQEHAAALPQLHGAAERRHGRRSTARRSAGRAGQGRRRRRSYDEAELTRVRQRVGMVFQQFNLFPHMTALGNVMEGLRTVRAHGARPRRARAPRRELARVGPRRQGRRTTRRSSRAARSSASPSPARWPWTPRCCCSTSRPRRSTPSWSARCCA